MGFNYLTKQAWKIIFSDNSNADIFEILIDAITYHYLIGDKKSILLVSLKLFPLKYCLFLGTIFEFSIVYLIMLHYKLNTFRNLHYSTQSLLIDGLRWEKNQKGKKNQYDEHDVRVNGLEWWDSSTFHSSWDAVFK